MLVKMREIFTPNVTTYEAVMDPMKREEAWLTFAHCARVGSIYDSNPSQFVVMPVPKGSVGMGSVAGTSGFAIIEGAPHHDLAVKFLEYMTRPEIQLQIAKGTGGFIPPVDEAVKLLTESPQDEIIKKALHVMDQGVLAFIPSTFGPEWGAVKTLYEEAFKTLVIEKGIVDQDYLDNAQEEMDAHEVEGLLLRPATTKRKKK
jgi:multiple sugar transport system substrate-binding protein